MTPEQIKEIRRRYNDAGCRSSWAEDRRDEMGVLLDSEGFTPEQKERFRAMREQAIYNMGHADGEQKAIGNTLSALGYGLALEDGTLIGIT